MYLFYMRNLTIGGNNMQSKLFRSKMVLYDDTLQTVSECLGITRQTLAEKLQGTSEFKQTEIDRLITRWNLTPHEVVQIFFDNPKSHED